ncbi:MAG: CPBP family intramembrane metalloprotease [Caldilineales bacterium]|nr:CPBP family intramembrane metalloprotease [Caldilineales bacterium]
MPTNTSSSLKKIFAVYWRPNQDLAVVVISWLLVVGTLYTATKIVGSTAWGGMAYFFLYAVVGATLFGVGIPLYWMTVVRRRSIADLGITRDRLGLSIAVQIVLAALLYVATLAKVQLPPLEQLVPLAALALTIGFFEAIFWRGWVLLRLEESFGVIPAIVLGSLLYAFYHIGYGMAASEMVFLFFVGVMFAVVFRLTQNVFILWPLFQPMGQLVTLIREELTLPLLAALGFVEVLALMFVLLWLAARYHRKHSALALSA